LAEEELLTALGAAERLQPSEIARLPDSELMPSLKVVLKQIQPSQLPAPTLPGMVRRKALTCIEQPQELVATLWPVTEALSNSQGDPATKVQEFDPYKPRMCEPYTILRHYIILTILILCYRRSSRLARAVTKY